MCPETSDSPYRDCIILFMSIYIGIPYEAQIFEIPYTLGRFRYGWYLYAPYKDAAAG